MSKKRKIRPDRVIPHGENRAMSDQSDLDREWFDAHPEATFMLRAFEAGELGPEADGHGYDAVLVEKFAVGVRARHPMRIGRIIVGRTDASGSEFFFDEHVEKLREQFRQAVRERDDVLRDEE